MRRVRRLFRKRALDNQLDSELRFHVEQQTADNIAAGMSPTEARRRALAQFGGLEYIKEETRDARGTHFVETLLQDLRYAFRMLRKSPGFTAVAVLTLALGIGANTAIFSVVDAVLLQSLPYSHPEQLVSVFDAPPQQPGAEGGFSYTNFAELRKQNLVFSEMAGNQFHDLTLTGAGEPSELDIAFVTPEIFSLLNAKPLAGRTFLPEDGKQGAVPVVILNENLWRSRFNSNPSILGQSIILDKRPFTVVGIMPASFRYPRGVPNEDAWIPLVQDPLFGPWMQRPGGHWLRVVGRLKSGISRAQAQADMDTLSARLAKESPAENSGWTIHIEPYQEAIVGNVKSALLILLGAVGLVLLIACVNIANLLLARATFRAREIAVRIALGAGRPRVVRQLLTESALLGSLGGLAGVLLAVWAVWSLRPLLPSEVTQINPVHVGGAVLAFALVLSLVAALAFGLAPALLATSSNLQANIKDGGGRAGQRGGRRVRNVLATAEISLAMVLLVAGGLLIRSFALLTSVNPGFDPKNVVKAEVSLPQFQYKTPQQWTAFSNELLARVQTQPGLQDSAMAAPLPLVDGFINLAFDIVGNPPLPPGESITADYVAASPDYFHVMRIPLLRGRLFSQRDSPSAPPVALISETLAQRYFPNQDPIGKHLKIGFPPNGDVSREVVGIVGDVRDAALGQKPGPMIYAPFAQAPFWEGGVVVRSSLSESSVAAAVRQATHAIDKDLPVTDIESFPDALGESVSQERFRTYLLGSFSAIALVLAAIGIFGVISYSALQRTHEIGIRIALGAQRRDVLLLILGQGAKLALFGLALGVVAAFLFTRVMASLLFGVSATDPVTFSAVTIVLLGVALLACYIPARRAMRVDPMVALRYE